MDKIKSFWIKVLWLDETKTEWFGHNDSKVRLSIPRTLQLLLSSSVL